MNDPIEVVETLQFPRLAKMFYFEPLALEVTEMLSLHAYLWPRLTQPDIASYIEAKQPTRAAIALPQTHGRSGYLGPNRSEGGTVTDARYFYTLESNPSVAVLPIRGVMMRQASTFQEMCAGAISGERIAHALAQVKSDKSISTAILDIRSPGGDARIGELAAQVRDLANTRGKTVYAFTDGIMASAAYRLGSQANELVMTPDAQVGSIGTYIAFLNETVRMQMTGTKMEVIKAGTLKAMGLPGTDLTQEQRNYLQATVEDLNQQFHNDVKAMRPQITQAALDTAAMYPGSSLIKGATATANGLADGIESSWQDFIAQL